MKKVLIIVAILIIAMISQAAKDKNSLMRQEGNRGVVRYDLVGDAGEDAEVNLSIEYNGKRYTQDELSITGDIGKVVTGSNKAIFWDVIKDFPRGLVGTVDWFLDVGGKVFRDPVTGMEFVFVKGGCYQMGSNSGISDEKPVHEVCVDDFYIGKYEVTQGEWEKVMGNNPSRFTSCGSDCPVETVSWDDAKDFIRKLNSRSSVTFRLPKEAEWEYAAKGGENHTYSGSDNVDSVAWYGSNSGNKTHRVGTKQANGFGLYDMSGNVWEWVEDVYNKNAYSKHQRNNPIYTGKGSYRVLRGGSWNFSAGLVRSADRSAWGPGNRDYYLGFRVLRTVR